MDVLLGGNRNTILGRRGEMPLFQGREQPVVDGRAEAVKYYLLHNGPLLVDGNFDDDIAFNANDV